jgi:hypothetical protein
MSRFRGYDLTIASPFDLPGATPLAGGQGAADIVIEPGRVPAEAAGPVRGVFQACGKRILVRVPACHLLCDNGGSIRVAPQRGATDAALASVLITLGLPALLWMRGEIVLHAGAAVPPASEAAPPAGEAAIVYLGPSGSGKSTAVDRELGQIFRPEARVQEGRGDVAAGIVEDRARLAVGGPRIAAHHDDRPVVERRRPDRAGGQRRRGIPATPARGQPNRGQDQERKQPRHRTVPA